MLSMLAVIAVAAGVAGASPASASWQGTHRLGAAASSPALAPSRTVTGIGGAPAAAHQCFYAFDTRNGRTGWYAGYDNTWTTETHRGHIGNRVIEVQCLVIQLGYSVGPSGADGDFGPDTESGVRAVQRECFGAGSPEVDGRVGPHTWPCLRLL
jgi:hypothetical protein